MQASKCPLLNASSFSISRIRARMLTNRESLSLVEVLVTFLLLIKTSRALQASPMISYSIKCDYIVLQITVPTAAFFLLKCMYNWTQITNNPLLTRFYCYKGLVVAFGICPSESLKTFKNDSHIIQEL